MTSQKAVTNSRASDYPGWMSEATRLIDIKELAELTGLSKPTIWRMNEDGLMPSGAKVGLRSVRWRLRTGNPQTGILDWIENGCVCVAQPVSSPSSQEG